MRRRLTGRLHLLLRSCIGVVALRAQAKPRHVLLYTRAPAHPVTVLMDGAVPEGRRDRDTNIVPSGRPRVQRGERTVRRRQLGPDLIRVLRLNDAELLEQREVGADRADEVRGECIGWCLSHIIAGLVGARGGSRVHKMEER